MIMSLKQSKMKFKLLLTLKTEESYLAVVWWDSYTVTAFM